MLLGALRDAMLWVETPHDARPSLFPAGAAARRLEQIRSMPYADQLHTALVKLAAVTADPGSVETQQVVDACRAIIRWAEMRGAPGTRLAFMQVCALAAPADPRSALEVARLARDLGEHARAESWFRHAVQIARNQDWESYVWAYVGLGVLYIRTGNLPAARAVMVRALRSSRRRRLSLLEGVAHHHLFHLETEAGHLREAYAHARAALAAYGDNRSKLPGLASDVGRFWLCIGEPARAFPLFEAAHSSIPEPDVRAMVAANAAQAAAEAGDREAYERARLRALDLIQRVPGRSRLAEAYLRLAYGDAAAGEWTRAEEGASVAASFARADGQAEVRLAAVALLERVQYRRAAPTIMPPAENPVLARQGARLAEEFLRALARLGGEP